MNASLAGADALARFTCSTAPPRLRAHNLSSLSKPAARHVVAPLVASMRHVSSTSSKLSKPGNHEPSAADLHALYHDQMKEIQSEREAIFGSDPDDTSGSPDLSQAAKSYFASNQSEAAGAPPNLPPGWDAEEAYAEREAIYAFSEEEISSWSTSGSGTRQISSAHLHRMREIMRESSGGNGTAASDQGASAAPSPFTHLTPRGDGVSMVDVGHKNVSRRVALARSVVVFPPEVMSAFRVSDSNSEMIGPKGPIFETAKIAGIMGAK